NLGVVRKPDGDGFVMADVPGLVEGASTGVGLGHQFLRHLERTRLLIHLTDISDENLEANIATIANELHEYSEKLEKLPQILALNKIDVMEASEAEAIAGRIEKRLPELLPAPQEAIAVVLLSCATTDGIDDLRNLLVEELAKLPEEP